MTQGAIDQAEAECLADAEVRARQRERSARRAVEQDKVLTEKMTAKILELFPPCPPQEAQTIARHATIRGSGRVGRTSDGRSLQERSVSLAVIASVRHRHTDYDNLLMRGCDRADARNRIRTRVEELLEVWRG